MDGSKLVQHLLEWSASQTPEHVAIIDEGREVTYEGMEAHARHVAGWLWECNIRPGDRVLMLAHNSHRMIQALFGVLKAGAIAVPVIPDIGDRGLQHILHDSAPKAMVVDAEILLHQKALLAEANVPVLITRGNVPAEQFGQRLTPWEALPVDWSSKSVDISPNHVACIIYTSGSTSKPKGVVCPHRQILFATTAINTVIENRPDDVILCGLPFSFDYGLYQIFLAFQKGARLVLQQNFKVPLIIPQLLKKYHVTGFPGVPPLFALLLRSRMFERVELPRLRYLTSTGDVFPPAHIRRLRELLPHVDILPMYGLTECKRVSITPPGGKTPLDSVGWPLPGTSVEIVDEQRKAVVPGEVGELVVRGPHLTNGYWNDPEETTRRFQVDPSTGERILFTGDFFRMDADRNLYFVGRREMFIKSRGQRVSPAEVEVVLADIPGVAEAAVVGIPDAEVGEHICAFVVEASKGTLSRAEIRATCRKALRPAARPARLFFVSKSLPRTDNGKMDRATLRQLAQSYMKENPNDYFL